MNTTDFSSFLSTLNPDPITVLDNAIPLDKYVSIDLSAKNRTLKSFNINSSSEWEQYINKYLKNKNALVAYGGYLEKRNLYKRSPYFNNQTFSGIERNIHLGLDLWISANSKIYTPVEGKVHSFANNTNFGDYGPTIILEHLVCGFQFFTLYGHLSLESIKNIKVGQLFKANDCLATLGDASVNGDYAPHLHFQIIKDIQSCHGDYPGVCSRDNLEFYKNNCPNPNTLLKLY